MAISSAIFTAFFFVFNILPFWCKKKGIQYRMVDSGATNKEDTASHHGETTDIIKPLILNGDMPIMDSDGCISIDPIKLDSRFSTNLESISTLANDMRSLD